MYRCTGTAVPYEYSSLSRTRVAGTTAVCRRRELPALAAPRDFLGGLALVGLPRAEPRRAIAAVGAWLCEGWCHLSAAVAGHRGGCVRHPGATLEGGGKEQ